MLELLHIENIAIIELADIMFQKGFNVLSGETGAGKSIVIDSLSAVIGERTSRDLIRTGTCKAFVSAIFSNVTEEHLEGTNVVPDENNNVILEREIQQDGRNSCRVNGRIVTVSQLKMIGNRLLNIHGQHDGQQLLDEAQHGFYLDNYGKLQPEINNYHQLFKEYRNIEQSVSKLKMDESEKARKIDTLKFQIQELTAASLKEGEEEELQNKKNLMKNSEKYLKAVSETDFLLSGDDNSDGILMSLKQAMKIMESLGDTNSEIFALSTRLSNSYYEITDIASSVNDFKNHFDFSKNDLDKIESRLDLLYRMKKKYGPTVEDMMSYLENCKRELETIELSDIQIEDLQKKLSKIKEEAISLATKISVKRKEVAKELKKQIESELYDLDMPKVQFEVQFIPCELYEEGMEKIAFIMSANVGEELKPISKIASGGELARIMLALKNVLSEQDYVQTMVFDEIDTGVSGRAAQKVAQKMSDLSKNKQVLCVTHLPQIAAMADDQFMVSKDVKDGRTYTIVKRLDSTERKNEIARLTGGSHISEIILEGAGELLQEAESYKNK